MARTIANTLGEIAQPAAEGARKTHASYGAAWTLSTEQSHHHPADATRTPRKRGGCKTCQGKACSGHCRF